MERTISSYIEARLRNNKELAETLKRLAKYQPSSVDIRVDKFSEFINNVEAKLKPFKTCEASLQKAVTRNMDLFRKIKAATSAVMEQVIRIKGKESDEYRSIEKIVSAITTNVLHERSHSEDDFEKGIKEGKALHCKVTITLQQLHTGLENFRELIRTLRSFASLNKHHEALCLASLETLEKEASSSTEKISEKQSVFEINRDQVLNMLDNKGGLRDRAKRAKIYVRKKYGIMSPEYRATVHKRY